MGGGEEGGFLANGLVQLGWLPREGNGLADSIWYSLAPWGTRLGLLSKHSPGKGLKLSKLVLLCLASGPCASPCFLGSSLMILPCLRCSLTSRVGHLYGLTILLPFELCPYFFAIFTHSWQIDNCGRPPKNGISFPILGISYPYTLS